MVENTKKVPQIVVDASAVLSYIFPDEVTPKKVALYFRKLSKGQINFVSSPLLKFEIGNAIKSAVKQKRTTETDATDTVNKFNELTIHYLTPDLSTILLLSLKHNLTFYDASYLCLAQEQNAKLLTLDKKLLACHSGLDPESI